MGVWIIAPTQHQLQQHQHNTIHHTTTNKQVRFLARGFTVPGDHPGQTSSGNRWPFGAVALITPFNFPLEIPALQLMGALFTGNRPLVHVDHRVRWLCVCSVVVCWRVVCGC